MVNILVILAYDIINVKERSVILNRVHKTCRMYLFQVQKSVFYGNLTKPLLDELLMLLKIIIDINQDSILLIKIKNQFNSETELIGNTKILDNII